MEGINDHVRNVCKIGKGHECCRYMVLSSNGFECVKNTEMKTYLDSRATMKTIVARGDNCLGQSIEFLNKI